VKRILERRFPKNGYEFWRSASSTLSIAVNIRASGRRAHFVKCALVKHEQLNQSPKDHPIHVLIIGKNTSVQARVYLEEAIFEEESLKSSSEHDFAVTCYFLSWLVCHHWAD
jgi:hypothetical protein